MKKPKILVVGSFVMDLIVSAKRFPNSGETVIGHGFSMAAGGKGANQAVCAAKLGADVTMVGKVGRDDFGVRLIESAKNAGVNTEHILLSDTFPSAVGNVQLQTGGERSVNRICVVPGANMDITLSDIQFLKEEIKNFDIVILQLEIPVEINKTVAKYAKDSGVPVMLNPAPYAELDDEFLSYLTYISPNEHEAEFICGHKICDIESAKKAVFEIYKKHSVNSLITLGKNGVVYFDGEDVIHSPTIESVKAVDPTAAGDSFVAAFCVAICSGLSALKALQFGNYVATLTVSKMGAQTSLPTKDDVEKFIIDFNGSIKDFDKILGE